MASKLNPTNLNHKQISEMLTSMETVDKKNQWISKKLKVTKRGWFGKLVWNLIFKRFAWTRSLFGINPEISKQNLILLKSRIKSFNDSNLNRKYLKVINHFNKVFNRHTINTNDFVDMVSSQKWNRFLATQTAAQAQGANLSKLLAQSIHDNEPETALWLIKDKGVSLDSIVNKELEQSHGEMLNWLKAATQSVSATPENLDHFALKAGYGYKTANLMVMDKKTSDINKTLKTAIVKVPPYLPISDYEMRSYILKSLPEIQNDWKKFLESFDKHLKNEFIQRDAKDPKVPNVKITNEGRQIIESIQKKVADHFADNSYFSPQIKAWLEKEKPELLIVRSTGKEDTENNSNAGGNDSIPFVKPQAQEISETIGRVLASYFGEKSVTQRLLAGDHSLFTQEKPFLPVLLQVMVMENGNDNLVKDPLDIPRSGVMFTTQNDKAQDITFIQTGLGNNEGVVTSQVEVDSYHVDKKGNVHSIVKDKKTRFVRTEKNGRYEATQINNNDIDLQRSQALPNGVIRDMKKVADGFSYQYSNNKNKPKPLDMEYTVKLKDLKAGTDKPVIYLLQARPLISGEVKAQPSYIDLTKLEHVPEANIQSATVLIDIRNDIRNIENSQQILFADNLPNALKKYKDATDPQLIKTIIVRKSAPSTSHESVILRPKGLAVLVIEDPKTYNKVEKMAEEISAANPLKIDTQRGLIISTKDVADHKALELQGLISYPAPREVSIPQSSFFNKINAQLNPKQREVLIKTELKYSEERYVNLVQNLLEGKPPFPFKDGEPNAYSLHRLFDVMATGNTVDAKRALGTLLKMLHAKLHTEMKESNGFQANLNTPMFNLFQYAMNLSEREIILAMYKAKPQSMERLYPLKFLEAAVFQQPGNDVIAGHSYAKTLKTKLQTNRGLQRATKLKLDLKNNPNAAEIVAILEMGSNAAASQKTIEEWENFIAELAKSKDVAMIQNLHALLNGLHDLNLLSTGINVVFMDLYNKQKKKYNQVIQELVNEVNQNKNTFDWIQANLKLMPSTQQIGAWADPTFAGKQIPNVKNQFLNAFGFGLGNTAFLQKHNSSTKLGKLALLEFMNKSVNTYDEIIKQVSGSAKYPEDRKLQAKHFAELLEPYFEMMQSSLKLIPTNTEMVMMKPTMGTQYTFNMFIEKMKLGGWGNFGPGFNKLLDESKQQTSADPKKLFDVRSEFAVASLVVGSKIDLDFHVAWPASLEEYFTTFHQNMEAVRNILTTELGLNKTILSHQPENICNSIEHNFQKGFFKPAISYMNQQGQNTEIIYNIPLRQHAGSLGVKFNPQTPDSGVEITVKMMGNHEHNRWYQAAMFGAWLGNSPPLSLVNNIPPIITWNKSTDLTRSVEFTINIPSDYPKTQALFKALDYCMMTMTMGGRSEQEIINQLETVNSLDELDPNFFASTCWGNLAVMGKLFDKQSDVKLAQAIKGTLLGLLKNNTMNLEHNFSSTIQNYIKKVVARNPEAIRNVINELEANPNLKAMRPEIWNCISSQKALLIPPDQMYQEAINKKDWRIAMRVADTLKNHGWKDEIIQKMKALTETDLKVFIQSLDYESKKLFTEQYCKNINPVLHAQIEADIAKGANRGRHLALLGQNIQTLQSKLNNFNANAEEIVELSRSAIIGLSQNADFRGYNVPYAFENYIPDYVGKAPYHYVWDNIHNDTKKLRKGAPLCIIKAMSLAGTSGQAKAFNSVEMLINDYLEYGPSSAHNGDMKAVVYALSKAYYTNMQDKAAASANLKTWWRNSPEHINILKAGYPFDHGILAYNLPL